MNVSADLASRGFLLAVGIILFFSVTVSLMRTVIVPRPLRSLFTDAVMDSIITSVRLLARVRRTYAQRDGMLAWIGPLLILGMLLAWLIGFIAAYGFMLYGISASTLGDSLRQAGSSLLTLGFAGGHREDQTILDFMAAATGPIVIAMLIGFLPTIYQAYLEREVEVTLLAADGGEPCWGPELLARSALTDSLDSLNDALERWTIWAATVRLTHTTYPVLLHVRSPRATRHFAVALLAVMDAAALKVSVTETLPRRNAYRLLLQGTQAFNLLYIHFFARHSLRSRIPFVGRFMSGNRKAVALSLSVPAWDDRITAVHAAAAQDSAEGLPLIGVDELATGEERGTTLSRAEFDHGVDVLRRSGFPIERGTDDAWLMFSQIRSRYEFPAYAIIRRLDAVPAPWSGDRRLPSPTIWPTLAIDMLPRPSDETPGTSAA